jgi:hypothetical protein
MEMNKCKACGMEVENLKWNPPGLLKGILVHTGEMYDALIEETVSSVKGEYNCPYCDEVLFDNLEEAVRFLKDEHGKTE